jgi:hypothetical protein
MKNKISDLRNILFEQLERLNDDELSTENLDKEAYRTSQMVQIAETIIDSARAETEFIMVKNKIPTQPNSSTGFILADDDTKKIE